MLGWIIVFVLLVAYFWRRPAARDGLRLPRLPGVSPARQAKMQALLREPLPGALGRRASRGGKEHNVLGYVECEVCADTIAGILGMGLAAVLCEEGCGVADLAVGAVAGAGIKELVNTITTAIREALDDILPDSDADTISCVVNLLTKLLLSIEDPVEFITGGGLDMLASCLCFKIAGVCDCSIPCIGDSSEPHPTPAELHFFCGDDLQRTIFDDTGEDRPPGLAGCARGDDYFECLAKNGHAGAIPWNNAAGLKKFTDSLNTCGKDNLGSFTRGVNNALFYMSHQKTKEQRCGMAYGGAYASLQHALARHDPFGFAADDVNPRCGGGTGSCHSMGGIWAIGKRNDCARCPPGQVLHRHKNPARAGLSCQRENVPLTPAGVGPNLKGTTVMAPNGSVYYISKLSPYYYWVSPSCNLAVQPNYRANSAGWAAVEKMFHGNGDLRNSPEAGACDN